MSADDFFYGRARLRAARKHLERAVELVPQSVDVKALQACLFQALADAESHLDSMRATVNREAADRAKARRRRAA